MRETQRRRCEKDRDRYKGALEKIARIGSSYDYERDTERLLWKAIQIAKDAIDV